MPNKLGRRISFAAIFAVVASVCGVHAFHSPEEMVVVCMAVAMIFCV